MGNSYSVPNASDGNRMRGSTRNKLSKPKVGNHRESPIAKPKVNRISDSLKDRRDTRERIFSAIFEIGQETPQNLDSIVPEYSSHTQRHHNPPTRRYSLRRRSSILATPRNLETDLAPKDEEQLGPISMRRKSYSSITIKRRRSQLIAPPPATATRRLSESGTAPTPFLLQLTNLATQNFAEIARAQTPSGYSTIGAFERGSLRVVNCTTSPSSEGLQSNKVSRSSITDGVNATELNSSYSSAIDVTDTLTMRATSGPENDSSIQPHEQLLSVHALPAVWCGLEALDSRTTELQPYIVCEARSPEFASDPALLDKSDITAQSAITVPLYTEASEGNQCNPIHPRPLPPRSPAVNAITSAHHTHTSHSECGSREVRRPAFRRGSDSGYSSTKSISSRKSFSDRNSNTALPCSRVGSGNRLDYAPTTFEPSKAESESSWPHQQHEAVEGLSPTASRSLQRCSSYRGLDSSIMSISYTCDKPQRELRSAVSNNDLGTAVHASLTNYRIRSSSVEYRLSHPVETSGTAVPSGYSELLFGTIVIPAPVSQITISHPDTEYYRRFRKRKTASGKLCSGVSTQLTRLSHMSS